MKRSALYFLLLLAAAAGACKDDDDSNNNDHNLNDTDRSFIEGAAYSNRAEVELGRLASERSTNESVRWFANHMQEEHSTAQDELESLADDVDVNWPDGLDLKAQTLKNRLSNMSGYAFDTAYMHSQVMAHEEAVALFDTELDNGRDADVRAYANKYLPHIEMHLEHADSITALVEVEVD